MAHILVVDDEPDFRALLRAGLEAEGHQVEEAADGAQAVQVVRNWDVDLVFCDIFMPGRDGLETIQELRGEAPRIPVVAMSGGGCDGLLNLLPLAERLGAAGALAKPFGLTEALAAVRSVLAGPCHAS
jgi:CheY-like chemotaxis protein